MKISFPQISQIAQAVEEASQRPGFKEEQGGNNWTCLRNLYKVCAICEICG
jgi:hypothetical protein